MTVAQRKYHKYLKSYRWSALRRLRLWMDNGRCRVCDSNSRLEVHHRSYKWKGKSWFYELIDLTTLCHKCHSRGHSK